MYEHYYTAIILRGSDGEILEKRPLCAGHSTMYEAIACLDFNRQRLLTIGQHVIAYEKEVTSAHSAILKTIITEEILEETEVAG